MFKMFLSLSLAVLFSSSSCADAGDDDPVSTATETHAEADHHHKYSPRPYDVLADAWADLDATLSAAKKSGKKSIIVMGANWCHDSRGLAYYFENPEFRASNITPFFEQVYIDVGEKNRNIDIAQKFGLEEIKGTPTIFVLSTEGEVLNLDTAPTWRNAASRSEDEIIEYFKALR